MLVQLRCLHYELPCFVLKSFIHVYFCDLRFFNYIGFLYIVHVSGLHETPIHQFHHDFLSTIAKTYTHILYD